MTTTELSNLEVRCPYCRGKIARAIGDELPHIGDYAFCKGCGEVGVFTDRTMHKKGLAIRKPTIRERWSIGQHPDITRMRREWMP